jgi:hypothetical protein
LDDQRLPTRFTLLPLGQDLFAVRRLLRGAVIAHAAWEAKASGSAKVLRAPVCRHRSEGSKAVQYKSNGCFPFAQKHSGQGVPYCPKGQRSMVESRFAWSCPCASIPEVTPART